MKDYEKLYSLDVLSVEDRGENNPSDVHREFQENISKDEQGRYELGIPLVPMAEISGNTEMQSRKHARHPNRGEGVLFAP